MGIDKYKEEKNEFQNVIDSVLEVCKKYNDENRVEQLNTLKKNIEEDVFRLLVVGEFSRGKSTLVNALLGKKILPSDPNPTTVMLNEIREGDENPRYIMHYKDAATKELSKDEFEAIVAKEPEQGKNQKEKVQELYADAVKKSLIDHAEIIVRNDFGELGIDIVDTPGMNDINTVREEITLNYIPKADAAIIVCSALEPLSRSEFKFINEQLRKKQIDNLFVAVNYCDLLRTEEDRRKIFNQFKNGLNQIIPSSRISLVSAKNALKYKRQQAGEVYNRPVATYAETGFDSFEKNILEHLAVQRGAIKLQRFSKILMGIIDEFANSTMEIRKQATLLSREKLAEQVGEIRNKTKELEQQYKRELEKVSVELLKKQAEYAKEYEKQLRSMANAAMDRVEAYRGNDMEELYEDISEVIIWHKRKLTEEFLPEMQTDVERTYAAHMEGLGEEFAQVGLSNNALLLQMGEDENNLTLYDNQEVINMLASRHKNQGDAVEDFMIGAVSTAVVVGVVALCVANPAILVGAAIASKIGGKKKAGQKSVDTAEPIPEQPTSIITNDMVKAVYTQEIKKCYFTPIPSQVTAFRNEYEKGIQKTVEKLEQECRDQMDNIRKQFEVELAEKDTERTEIQDKLNEIKKDLDSLFDIKLWCGGFS